jgi:hypothetical protein
MAFNVHFKIQVKGSYQVTEHQLSGGGPVIDLSLRPEFESKTNLGLVDAVTGEADIQIGEHVSIVKLNEKKVKNPYLQRKQLYYQFLCTLLR